MVIIKMMSSHVYEEREAYYGEYLQQRKMVHVFWSLKLRHVNSESGLVGRTTMVGIPSA